MRTRGRLTLVCVAVAMSGAAHADRSRGNYGWLAETPISKYNKDDKKLLHDAAMEIVAGEPGLQRTWENPATGHHGTLTLIAVFNMADGTPCRQVRVQNYAKGLSGDSKVSVCKHPTRGWLLSTEEPPKA